MSDTYTSAFARYGVVLTNPQWSVSGFAPDGCLVVSFWQPLLTPGEAKRTWSYRDVLSEWKGNSPGRNEFRLHLHKVKSSGARIKLIIAHPATTAAAALIGNVPDESVIPKTFEARANVIGTLEEFDGDSLHIIFRPAGS